MKNSTNHIVWIDYLRIIACFMMVLAHSCDPFVGQFGASSTEFQVGTWFGSLMRACVPLFAMVSGVLLLPVKTTMGEFYQRRLSRIIVPLVIWSIVTPIIYMLYISNFGSISPLIDASSYTWSSAINKIAIFPLTFNYDTTPLWYLYMLTGVYLFMPIISPWLRECSAQNIRIFLYIWGFTLLIPYINLIIPFLSSSDFAFGTTGIFGVCDWNPFGTFYYFSGFLGYVVLAFYLRKFPIKWNWTKTIIYTITLFSIGSVITALGFFEIQKHFPGQYPMLEQIWFFNSFNVFLMTFAIFVIIQKINWKPSKFATHLANLTFGIYLSHFLIVQIVYDLIYPLNIPSYIKIPLIAICAFSSTAIIVGVIKKIPKSKYIIG